MTTSKFPYGTGRKVAQELDYSYTYVRDVLAGRANNEEILEKALEIATKLKEKREKQNSTRKKIASIATELKKSFVQEEAEHLVKEILP